MNAVNRYLDVSVICFPMASKEISRLKGSKHTIDGVVISRSSALDVLWIYMTSQTARLGPGNPGGGEFS